ncbi:MAG: hypothetical protein QM589_16915 [Thermomicrobiales bacterium]
MSRSVRTVVATLIATIALGGSSFAFAEATPATNDAYADEFADAREEATSDFERDVLADGRITQAEYDEAVQHFATCLRGDPGFEVTIAPDPLIPGAAIYRIDGGPDVPPEVRMRIVESCAEGTIAIVEPLFIATIVNPEHADFDEMVLACLHDGGLVATDFDEADLAALREAASSETARINPNITSGINTPAPDKAVAACLVNPIHIGLDATPAASPAP